MNVHSWLSDRSPCITKSSTYTTVWTYWDRTYVWSFINLQISHLVKGLQGHRVSELLVWYKSDMTANCYSCFLRLKRWDLIQQLISFKRQVYRGYWGVSKTNLTWMENHSSPKSTRGVVFLMSLLNVYAPLGSAHCSLTFSHSRIMAGLGLLDCASWPTSVSSSVFCKYFVISD